MTCKHMLDGRLAIGRQREDSDLFCMVCGETFVPGSKLETAEYALERHGYRRSCNIPACNCGDQWNHGGYAAERLRELADVLYENGKTPLTVAQELVAKLEKLQAENDRLWGEQYNYPHRIDEQDAEIAKLKAALAKSIERETQIEAELKAERSRLGNAERQRAIADDLLTEEREAKYQLELQVSDCEKKLGAALVTLHSERCRLDQARRDARQALDILEAGEWESDPDQIRTVRLRLYQIGKPPAADTCVYCHETGVEDDVCSATEIQGGHEWTCTRRPGHEGPHVACGAEHHVAMWPAGTGRIVERNVTVGVDPGDPSGDRTVYRCERCGWVGEGEDGCGTHACNPPPRLSSLAASAAFLRDPLSTCPKCGQFKAFGHVCE